jgi:predicted permease
MLWLQRLTLRLRSLVLRDQTAREVDDELQFHIEREIAERVKQGMTSEQARTQALRAFGGMQRYKEEVRDAQGFAMWDQLRQDLAYAARTALRNPGFTAIVVLTLGLGVGATTAIFSVVRGVLLRDLPFAEPDRLVRLWIVNPARAGAPTQSVSGSAGANGRNPLSIPDFEEWKRLGTMFSGMAAYSVVPTGLALVDGGEPVRLKTAFISADFFQTLGIKPQLGRAPTTAEHVEGQDRVVVLSYRLWATRYGSTPDIVGRTLRLNDAPYTVIGVMPATMRFPERDTDVWAPLTAVPATGIPRTRGSSWLEVIARLAPGVSAERARTDLSVIVQRLAEQFANTNAGWTEAAISPLREQIVGPSRGRVLVLFGAVVLTLVLACVNVANLVLARSSRRARELAVRTALGAGKARLARQLFTESIALALAGGVLGVLLAVWGVRGLVTLIGPWLPSVGDVRIDGIVLAFALVISALTGVVFGMIPVFGGRGSVAGTLRESGRGNTGAASAHALRRALVALEVGLAMILVIGAGLLVKSFAKLNQVSLGFDVEHSLFVRLTVPSTRYPRPADYLPVGYRILDQVRQVPGVVVAALAKDGPMRAGGESNTFRIPAQPPTTPGAEPRANFLASSDGILKALGVRLEAGRDLTRQDGDTATAGVVISANIARRYWPARSPVGEEIDMGGLRFRIVGVAADARYTSVAGDPVPLIYVSNRISTRRIFTIVARTVGDPAMTINAVRGAIRSVERDQPITEIGTMRDAIGDSVAAPRVLTLLVGMFGAVALLLAAIGVYGVVSYVVGQRTNEIGIRIALGAKSTDIVRWTLQTGLQPALVGLVVGGAGALMLSRLLGAQLYEVSPTDPIVFGGVAVVLVVVAVLASGLPARRAARVDPAVALRSE